VTTATPVSRPKRVMTSAHARKAARGRWGPPRKVRLDNLTPQQAEAVVALVASLEAANGVEAGER
jgi:hypothetical protein